MSLSQGAKLGPYEIVSSIGKGGMGEVFRARDTRLDRDVAIKVMPQSFARDHDRLRRFEQEARSVAALNHPNLLTVFDVGTAPLADGEELPYLVSELLEGTTLRTLLSRGPLPLRKVLEYSTQIARGLAAAHEHGVVHRDIKPDNLFVTRDGRVKILDFGLAKLKPREVLSDETVTAQMTQANTVMGTVGYMSPEQLRGQPVDARSDIFSLGAVLYEMLSGHRAFQGDSSADVMSALLTQDPPELPSGTAESSPALDRMVRRCLEKDPQQRFQSAGDLAYQLHELAASRDGSTESGTLLAAAAKAPRSRWLAPLAAMLLTAAMAAVAWHGWHRSQAPPVFTPVSFQQGFVTSARLLHEGQTVLSVARWGTETAMDLHVGTIDPVVIRPLNTPADAILSVSVNDDILLVSKLQWLGPTYCVVGTLTEMHYGGGAPKPLLANVQYADWDREGRKFAVVRFIPESHVYRLEYPLGTVLYQTTGWVSHPRFSHDGKNIAFLDHPEFGSEAGSVAMVDLQGHVTKWKEDFGSALGLVWSPDGKEIWFSAGHGESHSLWAASMDGKSRPLLSVPGSMDVEDVLPDGRVLVTAQSERRVLMVSTPESPAPRDFTFTDWAYGLRFSRDGKQILFGDYHGNDSDGVYLRNLDGSPALRLGDGQWGDLSADGKSVVSQMWTRPYQIELLPTGTGEPRQLTHSGIEFSTTRWLGNDSIAANGDEPGHATRVYAIDMQGRVSPLTPEGTRLYAVSLDGKRLLTGRSVQLWFTNAENVAVENADGSNPVPVPGVAPDEVPLDFNVTDDAIYVQHRVGENRLEMYQIDLPTGKRTLLHTIDSLGINTFYQGAAFAVSPDGKSYAYEHRPAASTEYIVSGLH